MRKNIIENITETTEKKWNELINKKGRRWALVVNGFGEPQLLNGAYTGEVIARGNRGIQRKIKELMKEEKSNG